MVVLVNGLFLGDCVGRKREAYSAMMREVAYEAYHSPDEVPISA